MKLSEDEEKMIDAGLEIAFMHLREIIKDPKRLEKYTNSSRFFPVYLKDGKREALLLGVKPKKTSG
jgi:hypothetical protein